MLKSLPHLLALALMLSFIPCAVGQEKPAPDQGVSSRILKITCGNREAKPVSCDISLAGFADLEELKKVVCEAVCREKLADRAVTLRMSVKGNIGRYWLAVYIAGMLDIMHAERGEALPQHNAIGFSHKKQCTCEPNKEKKPAE